MAMTKKEQADLEGLHILLAFRWPMEPEPQRMPFPTEGTVYGWDFNEHTRSVEPAWSKQHVHGRGHDASERFASQNGKRLFETERQAYVALRWAMCLKIARDLRNVDQRTPDS